MLISTTTYTELGLKRGGRRLYACVNSRSSISNAERSRPPWWDGDRVSTKALLKADRRPLAAHCDPTGPYCSCLSFIRSLQADMLDLKSCHVGPGWQRALTDACLGRSRQRPHRRSCCRCGSAPRIPSPCRTTCARRPSFRGRRRGGGSGGPSRPSR